MRIMPIASGSAGNCYYVSDGASALLLDCGIPAKKIMKALWDAGARISDISGCLVTHEHGDHAKAARRLADMGVDIWASPGTVREAGLKGPCVHETPRPPHGGRPGFPWAVFEAGTFRVLPLGVEHDAAEPLMFGLLSTRTGERLVYATDTPFVEYWIGGVTHLMIEANYDPGLLAGNTAGGDFPASHAKRVASSHMSIDTALLTLERMDKSRLKEVWLLHLSKDNADAADFKRRAREICGCEVYVA